jgi:carbonic anhydrase
VGLKPTFSLEAFPNLEEDVRQSIARIEASPFIPNKSNIRGFIYEVETGRLREVSRDVRLDERAAVSGTS